MKTGFVSLIGAGPGDPELLTLKALKRLQSADVVVYDRLVAEEILAFIPAGAARIYAGKSCKQKAMTQDEINTLLISLAHTGRKVVRLKGGDPFIFGRGSEEALYLAQHHIPFEIIPGITAAQGCGAYAGIPLTHRGLATGIRYVTGHTAAGGEPELDWKRLADQNTTLVVYMGVQNAGLIAAKLIEHGLGENTPIAVVESGTRRNQRVLRGELQNLGKLVQQQRVVPPATLIIGKVTALADIIGWYMTRGGEEPVSPQSQKASRR